MLADSAPRMKKFFQGCLLVIAVLILLILSCSIYVHHPRFSKSPPSVIEVLVYAPASSDVAYRTNITERPSCEVILQMLRRGTFAGFGAKADGELNVRYENGATDRIGFTRSYHGDCSFFHDGFYSISSNELFRALESVGVDVSRIPKS